jgi:hypothetical protein
VLLLPHLVLRVQLVQNLHLLHDLLVYRTHRVLPLLPLNTDRLLGPHRNNKINAGGEEW